MVVVAEVVCAIGVAVGASVGITDGIVEGTLVGSSDGERVGGGDGAADGNVIGAAVGSTSMTVAERVSRAMRSVAAGLSTLFRNTDTTTPVLGVTGHMKTAWVAITSVRSVVSQTWL